MEWNKLDGYTNVFYKLNKFNGCMYKISITIEETGKSIRMWVDVSSGKKRRHLDIFEEKDDKSYGGIKALMWLKQTMLGFPEWFKSNYNTEDVKLYICIAWSDSRRRDIYSRLEKEGFFFKKIDRCKVLVKDI